MKKEKSAMFCLTAAVLAIIVIQVFFIIGAITMSKVIPKLDDNAYEIFSQTVSNRTGYIESEMYNRWSTIDDLVNSIIYKYPDKQNLSNNERLSFLEGVAPSLLTALRDTGTTGAFVILDDNVKDTSAHSSLYFIDSDPGYNDLQNNNDLMILKGPLEFLNKFKIPLHIAWNYGITLTDDNRDIFYKPYEAAKSVKNAEHLGYWHISTSLYDENAKVITYTKPLISKSGDVFGVAGVEISQDYLYKLLPQTEISGEAYNGYAIVGDDENGNILPLVVRGATLQKILPYGKNIELKLSNKAFNGYSIENNENIKLCGHYEKINLYNSNTPFSKNNWYVLGITNESTLTRYSSNFTKTLLLAISASIAICVVFSIIMGFFFSKPLQTLKKQISAFNPGDKLKLDKTGVLEVDALSQAIEQLNDDVLNSVLKTDKIINMVNIDIGSFEYKNGDDFVKVSQALSNMLSLPQSENGFVDKEIFSNCLSGIRKNKTPENIYSFGDKPVKWFKIEAVLTENGELGIVVDVTKDELARIAIKHERDFDTLTGIYNRFAFGRRMTELFAEKDFKYAAFVMCDLDNLKHINDTYGHDIGDKYIKATANFFLRYWSDKKAVFGRMSGDEFYNFIYGYDSIDEIRKIIFNMHLELSNEFIVLPDGTSFRLKMSSGVAWYPWNAQEFDELLRYADFAMYQGKRTIKGGIREFDEQIYKEQSYLITGKEELYAILDEQLFEYVFQPIISVVDGNIHGYEALMRPSGKTINTPDKLLHIAQLEGQLSKVERNTFYAVLELATRYSSFFKDCKLFINSVPNQILKENEYAELSRLYSQHLSNLVVEITESENINDASLARKKDLIKQWNAMLAIDDYGTGYSNDKLLLNLKPNYIKIDRFLVDGIENDKGKLDIVKKAVTFSKDRNIRIIAEGVETETQLSTLMAVGVDLIQGYFVAKPMSVPNFDCSEIAQTISKIHKEQET